VQKQFAHFIQTHNLCTKDQPVFVAVSGGIDSMVLLHLFKSAGYNITGVHVNFGLRGEESDGDEAFVQGKCEQWGVGFLVKRVLTKDYATSKGVSIQMAARDLRYDWFSELIKNTPGSVLATAHHVNDSGETMLMNLVRGTGIDGLTGIPVKNNNIIRPLAFATRDEISQYAALHEITWREDESNLDDHYQRNFVRHRVMTLLKEINPSLDETLLKNFSRLGAERELMERSLAQLKGEGRKHDENKLLIPKKALEGFIHKSGVLLRMIEEFGFNFSDAESIVASINGQSGKIFFSKTHQLVIDREDLIIAPLSQELFDLEFQETSEKNFTKDPEIAYLDADKIHFDLVKRKWREGDSFQPLGMKGTKKISDYLIDEKISVIDKQNIQVLTSNDQIVWLIGHRIDDRYKITEGTKRVLVITKTKRVKSDFIS
jgi:tRNA(Ile)-lysidine synthase